MLSDAARQELEQLQSDVRNAKTFSETKLALQAYKEAWERHFPAQVPETGEKMITRKCKRCKKPFAKKATQKSKTHCDQCAAFGKKESSARGLERLRQAPKSANQVCPFCGGELYLGCDIPVE